jgi:hypothetical protein
VLDLRWIYIASIPRKQQSLNLERLVIRSDLKSEK